MCFLQKKLAEIRNALREGKGWGIKHFQKEKRKKKGEESKKIYILIQDIHLSLYKKDKQIE